MKRFIVITSLLFISMLMMAQEVRISGKVVDRVTHDVLNGASNTVPHTIYWSISPPYTTIHHLLLPHCIHLALRFDENCLY